MAFKPKESSLNFGELLKDDEGEVADRYTSDEVLTSEKVERGLRTHSPKIGHPIGYVDPELGIVKMNRTDFPNHLPKIGYPRESPDNDYLPKTNKLMMNSTDNRIPKVGYPRETFDDDYLRTANQVTKLRTDLPNLVPIRYPPESSDDHLPTVHKVMLNRTDFPNHLPKIGYPLENYGDDLQPINKNPIDYSDDHQHINKNQTKSYSDDLKPISKNPNQPINNNPIEGYRDDLQPIDKYPIESYNDYTYPVISKDTNELDSIPMKIKPVVAEQEIINNSISDLDESDFKLDILKLDQLFPSVFSLSGDDTTENLHLDNVINNYNENSSPEVTGNQILEGSTKVEKHIFKLVNDKSAYIVPPVRRKMSNVEEVDTDEEVQAIRGEIDEDTIQVIAKKRAELKRKLKRRRGPNTAQAFAMLIIIYLLYQFLEHLMRWWFYFRGGMTAEFLLFTSVSSFFRIFV